MRVTKTADAEAMVDDDAAPQGTVLRILLRMEINLLQSQQHEDDSCVRGRRLKQMLVVRNRTVRRRIVGSKQVAGAVMKRRMKRQH